MKDLQLQLQVATQSMDVDAEANNLIVRLYGFLQNFPLDIEIFYLTVL
jgi:hypothetical protein